MRIFLLLMFLCACADEPDPESPYVCHTPDLDEDGGLTDTVCEEGT